MKNDQHGNIKNTEHDDVVNAEEESESTGFNRRKFIKTAVATAPVVLTITSRPVFASNCSESGQLSGNLSGADECEGEGCTPGFWKQYQKVEFWHYNYQPGDKFSDVFGVNPWAHPDVAVRIDPTLSDVLDFINDQGVLLIRTDNNLDNLTRVMAAHAVAALQNSANDIKYHYKVAEVIDMVNSAFSIMDKDGIESVKDAFEFQNELGCPY